MSLPFKKDRLILIAVGLLLLAAYGVYFVLRHPERLNLPIEADRVVLTVLTITMALLVVGLVFLLLRNLIKLFVERRHQVIGSRFRTKLVLTFLVLVLLPSVALFYAAATLIQQVNESLFSDPVEQITEDSKRIVDAYNQQLRTECERYAAILAEDIAEKKLLDPAVRPRLDARVGEYLIRSDLDLVVVYDGRSGDGLQRVVSHARELSGKPRSGSQSSSRSATPPAPPTAASLAGLAAEAVKQTAARNRLDRLDRNWQMASGASPILTGSPFAPISGAVLAARYLPPDLANRTSTIDKTYGDYKKMLKRQPAFKRIYTLLFSILTLLVLFAATWTGFYLTRQITVPIQALAEGTKAITSGNLDYRVPVQSGDEVGVLIDSFNTMTDELRSNREAIDTSRKQLQASYVQLEERRRYIEQLLENVPAAVISVDGRGVVATMNREAHRILRIPSDAPVQGARAAEVLGREELLPILHEIEDISLGEAPSHVREFEFAVDGRPVHLAVNVSARRDAEGRFQGVLIVMDDLTPLIRAQRTAAWREVARRIAHEIKNPLTPIQLSAQRILKKFNEGTPDFPRIVEEGVTTIVKEVTTLQSLVDAFSRFARMPAVAPVQTDPNAVVETALSLYDGMHPGIRFQRDLQAPLPIARLDPDQLKRVLINLIDNAIAAMDGQGTITLRTRLVPIEHRLRLVVEDDGPGIAPENKERLFVPYFSTKKRGTGLGLAIVNRIVSDHNGFIRVEDNTPRGTRFVIDLPV